MSQRNGRGLARMGTRSGTHVANVEEEALEAGKLLFRDLEETGRRVKGSSGSLLVSRKGIYIEGDY